MTAYFMSNGTYPLLNDSIVMTGIITDACCLINDVGRGPGCR